MKVGAAGLGLMYKPVQQAINAESNFAACKKAILILKINMKKKTLRKSFIRLLLKRNCNWS
ncbi:hypothetical protein LH398_12350 [Fusobacterium nucleatum]